MNPIAANSPQAYAAVTKKTENAPTAESKTADTKPAAPAPNQVTLSEEGRALLKALQELEANGTTADVDKSIGDKVESFTYGALGMKHPETIKEVDDTSYSAGQYLSAAATIGGLLLLL